MNDYKISAEEFNKVSISRLATSPGARTRYGEGAMKGEELKARMDEPFILFIKKFNAFIELVKGNKNGDSLLKEMPTGISDNHTVADMIRDIVSESAEFASYLSVGERSLLEKVKELDDLIKDMISHSEADNPHGIDAEAVGLGNVDNTSDEEKPLSAAAREAITKTLDDAKEYADETKVGKNGDQTISGALSISGDLLVGGSTYAKQIESLEVGDAVIVANADGVLLSELSGYVIRVNSDSAYAIVYDPVDECVKIGLGTYDDGERKLFTFTEGEAQVLATRDRIADGHIPVWDDEKKTFKDSGKKADEFIPKDSVQLYTNALKGSAIGEAVVITDISPIEHDMRVNVKSDNILPYPYSDTTKTVHGITFTDNGDGSITANGTATNNAQFMLISSTDNYILPAGIYTVSGCPANGDYSTYGIWTSYGKDLGNVLTFTANGSDIFFINITIVKGATVDNLIFYPQVKKGTTGTPWKPYVADTEAVKVIEYGKNVLPPINATITVDGVTAEFKDGFVSFSGSVPDGEEVLVRYTFSKDERKAYPAGKYRFGKFRETGTNIIAGAFSTETRKFVVNINIYGATANEKFTIDYVQIGVKENLIGKTIPLIMMVNTNDQAFDAEAEYEPYIEPIEYSQGEAIKSIYPTTTITTDTVGALVEVEYNIDINDAFAKMQQAIVLLGGII